MSKGSANKCTMCDFIGMMKTLFMCFFVSALHTVTEGVVLKSLSTRSASECCTVCGQTETCQGVSYEEQTNVCKIRGSLEEISDWVLTSGRETSPEAVKVHHFVSKTTLLTSTLCGDYLVSGESGVTDQQLTASTEYEKPNGYYGPARGRLFAVFERLPNGIRQIGGWNPKVNDQHQYIQVQFNETRIVRGIATQGRYVEPSTDCCYQRVTEYRALYSLDCATFLPVKDSGGNDKIFPGNTDQDSVVTNTLDSPVLARCFRINPVAWVIRIAVRFDVLGCVL